MGWIALADALRPDAAAAVATLAERGIAVTMLTGDHAGTRGGRRHRGGHRELARRASAARTSARRLRRCRSEGKVVGMVGDGVNDAPALAQADVSFAMGAGAGSALSAADLTLLRNDLSAVATAIDLSHATLAKIRQNLFFAFVYNVLGIPLAAFGLLTPPLAGRGDGGKLGVGRRQRAPAQALAAAATEAAAAGPPSTASATPPLPERIQSKRKIR